MDTQNGIFWQNRMQTGTRLEQPKTVKLGQTPFSYKNDLSLRKDLAELPNFAARKKWLNQDLQD